MFWEKPKRGIKVSEFPDPSKETKSSYNFDYLHKKLMGAVENHAYNYDATVQITLCLMEKIKELENQIKELKK